MARNLVSLNKLSGNATLPPSEWPLPLPAVDILFAQTPELGETGTGNCFEKNKPADFTYFSTEGVLPTDGCKQP